MIFHVKLYCFRIAGSNPEATALNWENKPYPGTSFYLLIVQIV